MRMVLALAFVVLPLAEIAVFIAVGSRIGVGWTLLLILATTIAGVATVRRQSLTNLRSARSQARTGEMPGRQIVHGALIAFAGILLILPGFITDAVGLLLLVPPLREILWRSLRGRIEIRTHARRGPGPAPVRPRVLDLSEAEFERQDGRHDEPREPGAGGDSPWRDVDGQGSLPRDEAPKRG